MSDRCPLCNWTIQNSFREHPDDCLPIKLWPAVKAMKDRIAELEEEVEYLSDYNDDLRGRTV